MAVKKRGNPLVIALAVLVGWVVVMLSVADLIGGTKICPLFGMSAEALAGEAVGDHPELRVRKRDAGL